MACTFLFIMALPSRHYRCSVSRSLVCFLWSPYGIGQTIIFSCCYLFFFLLLLFSSPNLSRRRLDVWHTSTHGVALVRIKMQVWNLLHAARWNTGRKKSPEIAIWAPSHNFVGLSSQIRHYRQPKNLKLSSNMSSTFYLIYLNIL